MDLINHTQYPHLHFRSSLDDDKFASAIMIRVTYEINNDVATPANEQIWTLSPSPWQNEYGPMEGDFVFKRGGVDILVFGSAIAPAGKAVKRMNVKVTVSDKLNHTILVIGKRHWQTGFLGINISEPEYFTQMPLTLANAYGGSDEWDNLKFPYANNPHGKGFIWEKENAVGKELPNIEAPDNLITKWNDRPFPAGITSLPMNENRAKKAVEFDNEGNMIKFDPVFYNAAFPELIVNKIDPGEQITVNGMTLNGTFKFTIPNNPAWLKLSFDSKEYERRFFIDQVGIEPNKNRFFITYRYAFNYLLQPLTKRCVEIIN